MTGAEQEIFEELAALCVCPGYIHAVAYFCFRDNILPVGHEMTEKDMLQMYTPKRLIRTEITTLIGLMVKTKIDYSLPRPDQFQYYITATENLLKRLHDEMSNAAFRHSGRESSADPEYNPLRAGQVMREAIFYNGESPYVFQYHDLAEKMYACDSAWLEEHVGFSIGDACSVASAIGRVQEDRAIDRLRELKNTEPDYWTTLPLFTFTAVEIGTRAGLSVDKVERVLAAFTPSAMERNAEFTALQDFNIVSAKPLLRMPNGHYILLQPYGLAEALYESPFYWMLEDETYRETLAINRGKYTESFVAERLIRVFGAAHVYANVDIYKSKTTKDGEIDLLVIWGNRVIVVQAKSKKLTLASRKGNDQQIRNDFRQSVQDAYDQAVRCAQCLGDSGKELKTKEGRPLTLPRVIKEIYILCVVSDHYPALSYQSRWFLKTVETPPIQPPLVLEVFALDAMTEMLDSPLRFLSYISLRAKFSDRIMASKELSILGCYLKHNLWINDGNDFLAIEDDCAAALDVAMEARRGGIPGPQTPDGILTRCAETTLGRIVKEIEEQPDPGGIELGLMLLALGENAFKKSSEGIDLVVKQAHADGRHRDITIAFAEASAGLTVHCNDYRSDVAMKRLQFHCECRKYEQKAQTWFGLCLNPNGAIIRFGITLDFDWVWSAEMAAAARTLSRGVPIEEAMASSRSRPKIGRNDRCPCGSGLKYKKCCLLGGR